MRFLKVSYDTNDDTKNDTKTAIAIAIVFRYMEMPGKC